MPGKQHQKLPKVVVGGLIGRAGEFLLIFFFQAKAKSGDLILEDKIIEARFFSQEEIRQLPLVSSAKWLFEQQGML